MPLRKGIGFCQQSETRNIRVYIQPKRYSLDTVSPTDILRIDDQLNLSAENQLLKILPKCIFL